MKQVSQRSSDLGEVLDESMGKSEKTSDLLDILQRSPIENCLDSFRVDGNTILGNHITKIGHFR